MYADFMKFLEMQDAARAAERADKLKQMQEMLLAALEEEETQKQQNAQVILVRMSNEDIVHWTRQPAEAMVVKNKKSWFQNVWCCWKESTHRQRRTL